MSVYVLHAFAVVRSRQCNVLMFFLLMKKCGIQTCFNAYNRELSKKCLFPFSNGCATPYMVLIYCIVLVYCEISKTCVI